VTLWHRIKIWGLLFGPFGMLMLCPLSSLLWSNVSASYSDFTADAHSAEPVCDCRSDASRVDREIQSMHFQDQVQQRWIGASTLLGDLCRHGDTLTSPRVSPLMWPKTQLTTTLPDYPGLPSPGMSSSFYIHYCLLAHLLFAVSLNKHMAVHVARVCLLPT